MKNICVFCGSSSGTNNVYSLAAKTLGQQIAARGKQLIYGGGNVGLMGIIADEVLANKGEVTGIIPHFLFEWEVGHEGLTALIKVDSMHERKLLMSQKADAFIAMPGGFGTLEELGEILTWIQLSIVQKPVGILNVNGFYDALLSQLDHMVSEGFLKQENRNLLISSDDPIVLLNNLENYQVQSTEKWIKPNQT
ncbi:MAG: TIGR00730 family Rossman fold protein [Cyclobacteriaceae bacterium]|nr:TIGR00730 family Rossman fold protein [Cyclobacteriaceae bacterium]